MPEISHWWIFIIVHYDANQEKKKYSVHLHACFDALNDRLFKVLYTASYIAQVQVHSTPYG